MLSGQRCKPLTHQMQNIELSIQCRDLCDLFLWFTCCIPYMANSQICRAKVKPCLSRISLLIQITETGNFRQKKKHTIMWS